MVKSGVLPPCTMVSIQCGIWRTFPECHHRHAETSRLQLTSKDVLASTGTTEYHHWPFENQLNYSGRFPQGSSPWVPPAFLASDDRRRAQHTGAVIPVSMELPLRPLATGPCPACPHKPLLDMTTHLRRTFLERYTASFLFKATKPTVSWRSICPLRHVCVTGT